MAGEFYPIIIERTAGTPGQPDAEGRLRRPTAAELPTVTAELLDFLPAQSLLGRASGVPTAIPVPLSSVIGRTASGSIGALGGSELDTLLSLTARLAQKADIAHTHAISDVLGLATELANRSLVGHTHQLLSLPNVTDGPINAVLTRTASGFAFLAGSGGGGVQNPLTGDLHLAGFALAQDEGGIEVEVLKYVGGRIRLGGDVQPCWSESNPQSGDVWQWNPLSLKWEHGPLPGGEVTVTPIPGLAGVNVQEVLEDVAEQLDDLAPAIHSHVITDLDPPGGATPGHVLTVAAGGTTVTFAAPPAGGGTVTNPLAADLDIAGFSIVSGATEIIRYAGGQLYLENRLVFPAEISSPVAGHVPIYNTGSAAFVNGFLGAAQVTAAAISGLAGDDVQEVLESAATAIAARALLSHTHTLANVTPPGGATVGHVVAVAAGGASFELVPQSGGGGGIANPLTANLDLATFAIVSGGTELLKYAGGEILIGTRAVFPSTISSPVAGEVPVYDDVNGDFRNRLLAAAEVTVTPVGSLSGDDVQDVLAEVAAVLAELASTDGLPEGDTNKYVTAGNITAAGGILVADISDDDTLAGEATNEVVSERAIKAYVDSEIALAGGFSGVPSGTAFPGSPADGDLFRRTDLREVFQYVDVEIAWVSVEERSITLHASGSGLASGSGAYILGKGEANGFRLPWAAVVTSLTFQTENTTNANVYLRRATAGSVGSVTTILTLDLTAATGGELVGQWAEVGASQLLSVFVDGTTAGVDDPHLVLTYRRRFDV